MARINGPKKPPASKHQDDEYEYYLLEDSSMDGPGSELKTNDILQTLKGVYEDGKSHVCHFKDGSTLVRYVRRCPKRSRGRTYYELTTNSLHPPKRVAEGTVEFELVVRSFRGIRVAMQGKAIGDEERPDEEARNADKERRIADLRRGLDRLMDITDESMRFRIEREIYDLEHAVDEDEWPEELAV